MATACFQSLLSFQFQKNHWYWDAIILQLFTNSYAIGIGGVRQAVIGSWHFEQYQLNSLYPKILR